MEKRHWEHDITGLATKTTDGKGYGRPTKEAILGTILTYSPEHPFLLVTSAEITQARR